MTKNDLLACHRRSNSESTIIKVLKRKHTGQIMSNKSKLKNMNFLEILNVVEASNTSDNIEEETFASKQLQKNLRIYINYSLCPYYRFLYGNVKEMIHEGLIHNFWISNGGIIKIRESASLAPLSVSRENDFILKYCFLL